MRNKINKFLCVILAFTIILLCFSSEFAAQTNENIGVEGSMDLWDTETDEEVNTPKEERVAATYYLNSQTGNDNNNGLTPETAFLTYKGAIAKAVDDAQNGGYDTADNIVYFKVADNDATTQWYDSTQNSYGAATHNFKLIITTDGTPTKAHLGGPSNSIEFNGPTIFEKQYFDYSRNSASTRMGVTNSLTLLESTQPRYLAGPLLLGTINNKISTKVFDNPVSFANNSVWLFRKVVLGSLLGAVYNDDVNIIYNNKKALPFTYSATGYTYNTHNFAFGSETASYTATFNKNVNFNLINADDVTLIKNTGEFAFGESAAVQILNSTGKAVNYDATMKAALFGSHRQVDTYVFNNNTGIIDLIAFTEKAGEYAVDTEMYKVIATPVGGGKAIVSSNGKLSVPAGEYNLTVRSSNGNIDFTRKMLYFYTAGDTHNLSSQVYVTAGETYCYEFGIYCNNFDSMNLFSDIGGAIEFTNIVKQKVDDYYLVKAEITIPSSSDKRSGLIGIALQDYSEGVIFDRTFYRKNDAQKVDQIVENQKFKEGLDGIKLDGDFWGNIYTGDRGGKGKTFWSDGVQVLKTQYFDESFIAELVSLANANDGEWWQGPIGDINGIRNYDIRDLVFAHELIGINFTQAKFNSVAEKNKNNVIDEDDILIIRKEILTNSEHKPTLDFTYTGYADKQRNTLLNKILTTPNTLEIYDVTGTVYYVSQNGSDSNDGKSSLKPTTLNRIKSTTLNQGDAVLFERGSVFRLKEWIDLVGGVVYGSYGTGDKPKILGSEFDFADKTWNPSTKRNVWEVDYSSNTTLGGGFFNDGAEIGVMKSSVRVLNKNMDFYFDKENSVIYLYSDKGNPSEVWQNIEFSKADSHMRIAPRVKNVTIDNLALKYMGTFAVSAEYDNHFITVTNCEIGYIGGEMMSVGTRYGNGIQTWCGGHDLRFENNWLYQVFDTATAPHGASGGSDYYNVSISGNLYEYNNGDIEYWEAGKNSSGQNVSQFYNWKMDNNIHRFTSLGWGTRLEEGIRGIQGVQVGQMRDHNITNFSWSNNIIDCPGYYIYNKNVHFEKDYKAFERKNNTYYIKQSMRRTDILTLGFYWENGVKYNNVATGKQSTLAEFARFEPDATVYWYE